jgi:hypothetical protein
MNSTKEEQLSDDEQLSSINGDESPRHLREKLARRGEMASQGGEDDMTQPGSWSCLKLPGYITPEAFDGKPNRVPRQIAAVLGLNLGVVMKTFDEVLDDVLWRQRKEHFSIEEIRAFADHRHMTLYVFHGCRPEVIERQTSDHHRSPLVMSYWSGHIYFLCGAGNLVKKETARGLKTPHKSLVKSLKRPPKERAPSEEFPWHLANALSSIPAGTYWVYSQDTKYTAEEDMGHNMEEALKLFIKSRRFPLLSYTRFKSPCIAYSNPVFYVEGLTAPKGSSSTDKVTQFTYHKTAYDKTDTVGSITVRTFAADAPQNGHWARNLGIPYGGQTLASFAPAVLDVLLKRRSRTATTEALKDRVLEIQGSKCHGCGDELGKAEFDHTIPLCKGGKDHESNIRALCGNCHSAKSVTEGSKSLAAVEPTGYLKSRFNSNVWANYVLSPPPPSMIYKDKGLADLPMTSALVKAHQCMDVIGSRRLALYNATALPVYTPLDDIQPVGPGKPLPDFVYVNKPVSITDLPSLLTHLPYTGPAWYARVAIEYCLHTHRLVWDDLEWGLNASGRVSGEDVRAALDAMEAAWEGVELNSKRDPMKDAVNKTVGFYGIAPGGVQISASMSYVDEHTKGGRFRADFDAFELKGLTVRSTVVEQIDPGSYRPLFDLCLCTEHTRLAQAHQAIQAISKVQRLPITFLMVTVDGIFWKKPRKNVTADLIENVITGATFEQLPRLEDYLRDTLSQPEPQQKRLRTAELYPLMACRQCPDPVFRVEHPRSEQHLRGVYELDKVTRDWHFEPPVRQWRDLSQEEAVERVLNGESLFVQGLAGTGKSYLIRDLIQTLEAQGKRCKAVAKTHAAAAVAQGATADHFAWKNIREGGTNCDVMWVDEVSMLDIELLCDMNHLSYRDPPVQWILSGDFNQYPPFFNGFRGSPVTKSFEDSMLLRLLAGHNRLTLTTCRRSDAALFGFYASLIPGGSRYEPPLQEVVAEARDKFHPTKARGFIPGTALAQTNLVISHRLRVQLNTTCNEADAVGRVGVQRLQLSEFYTEEQLQEMDASQNNPQDALFWPGLVMIACVTLSKKIKNALPYKIVGFEGDSVMFRLATTADEDEDDEMDDDGGEGGEEPTQEAAQAKTVVLSRAVFFKSFRLRYTRTYASIQGVTIEGLLALHDTNHTYFDRTKLFVGASRAKAHDLLVIY